MPQALSHFRSALLGLALLAPAATAAEVPTPESAFGHPVGADRQLAAYPDVLAYLDSVAAASDRVSVEEAGTSTEGNRMPVVILTSAANQARLERYREIARQLALPYDLEPEAAEALIAEGKAIALVTCTIHATEVGCTQMAAELVHEVATTEDPDRLGWLEETIVLLMPSINPDGQVMIVDWYRKHLDTEYEGGRMPWLYQRYVGHDNNRDFYMLTQRETQVVNELLYHRWFPQVFLDEHQMGSTGPRMFVPPQADPLNPEVHSLIFRQADLLGTNMGRRLEEAGKRGVGHDMIYDSYWPGGTRNTAWWKNVTGLLTEVASARLATPVWVEPGELQGGRKGLPEYQRRSNYPSPWSGGWWRLRDIVDYERIATWALIEGVAENRADFLRNVYRMAREAMATGASSPPYAFVIPVEQHDPVARGRLIGLLLEHGVRLEIATEPLRVGVATYPAGTVLAPADQPYRPFLLTMLRPQRYPEVRAAVEGDILPPYDVTSWSLPLSMGVEVVAAESPPVGDREPLTTTPWPAVEVTAAAGGWLLPHAADSVYTALNRLLADGVEVFWLQEPGPWGSRGDVWVPAEAVAVERLQALADDLHLPVAGLESAPTGPRYRVRAPRIGLYKPWVASMDEGWTRFLLEGYEFVHRTLATEDIRQGRFERAVDVVLLPDVSAPILARGEPESELARRRRSPLPPPYAGGLDTPDGQPPGGERLKFWVERGGTLVALDSAAEYVIDLFELPIEDDLANLSRDEFSAPGSMLRLEVDVDHPLGYGLRPEEAAYFASSPAFRTFVPDGRLERRVVAHYPDDERDLLLSGYLKGGAHLERKAAVVELEVGQGRIVLIGFRAQHRAQPLRTFKLLFNSLYWSKLVLEP